jgi:hypothetical protein
MMASGNIKPFTAEQDRVRANLASYYERWLEIARVGAQMETRLSWKTINGARYLYEIVDRNGNGKSLGRESDALQAHYADYQLQRNANKADAVALDEIMNENTRLYAALNLPMIDATAANICRLADVAGMMGTQLLVVGTNAMVAYELEAGARAFLGFDATADCDLAFNGEVTTFIAGGRPIDRTLMSLLKEIDSTYTVNTERSFQARNRQAYEVELLAAPSVMARLPRGELVPVSDMIEQEWLLNGQPVTQTLCGLNRLATRIVCPDPRWMALHKAWLADKPGRRRDKSPKDREQARRLFALIIERLPHYPMDAAFETALPINLQPVYAALRLDYDRMRKS